MKEQLSRSSSNAGSILTGGSEASELVRSLDWSTTPLGPMSGWSRALSTVAGLVLGNRFPVSLWWGPRFIQICNEAYSRLLGGAMLGSLGQSASECWADVWPSVGPVVEALIRGQPVTGDNDLFLLVNRKGFLEESHFKVTYNPVLDETVRLTGIGGILVTLAETTPYIFGERQFRTLQELAQHTAEVRSPQEACELAIAALKDNLSDLPFVLLYLLESNGQQARLAAACGFEDVGPANPRVLPVHRTDGNEVLWPLERVLQQRQMVTLSDMLTHGEPLPSGHWSESPHTVVALPLADPGRDQPYGVLIAGVSPHREFDAAYRNFYQLVADQVTAAIRHGCFSQEQRQRTVFHQRTEQAIQVLASGAINSVSGGREVLTGLSLEAGGTGIMDGSVSWKSNAAPPLTTTSEDRLIQERLSIPASEDAWLQRCEVALQWSELRFRHLFDSNIIGMLVVRENCVIEANKLVLQLTGYSVEELRQGEIRWQKMMPSAGPALDQLDGEALRRRGTCTPYETEWVRKDGRRVPVLLGGAQLIKTPLTWFGFVLDLTRVKQAETALQQANEELEQRVAKRTREVNALADQLRALAAELSNVEQRERKRLAQILHDHLQQLLVAARMNLELLKHKANGQTGLSTVSTVDSILSNAIQVSRSLAVELSPPVLHEAGLVQGLKWLAARMAEQNQFQVYVQARNPVEPAAEEMRFLLFECVRELLLNAQKHSGVNEAFVTLARTRDQKLKIVVEDQGVGFDPERFRARPIDKTTFGLFSIQQRLAYVDGQVHIDSAPGKGVRITLLAPLASPIKRPLEKECYMPANEPLRAKAESKPGAKIRVLLADDHRILREGLAGLIQLAPDIEIIGEASEGPEAIEMTKKLQPDVVIMDVNMPGISGIEATRTLKGEMPQLSIIGLSMHVDPEIASAMREAGATAYLSKEGASENLLTAIRRCRKNQPVKAPESVRN